MASQLMAVLALVGAFFNSGIVEMVLKLIEQMYQGYTGAEKKAIAMAALTPIIPIGARGVASAAIDAQVTAFNESGVFVHANETGAQKVVVSKSVF